MSAAQIKANLIQQIKQIEDTDLKILKAITALLDTYRQEEEDVILGYNTDGEPQYASVKIPQYLEDIEAAKAGEFYTLNDLEEWANPTKSMK